MKTTQVSRHTCETCGYTYDDAASAIKCESRPVSHDRGVKVGDVVKITQGDGKGMTATVERVYVLSHDWGHCAWERYWHTVALTAKVSEGSGHRILTFDHYETLGVKS